MAGISAYGAVFWRTVLAGALGLGIALVRGALKPAQLLEHARGLALGGLLMGAHFLLWIKAFDLTDYASNLLLLVAQPLFGTLLGRALGEATPRSALPALALSLLGMGLIAGADLTLGARALLGDALCILAGLLIALFYAAARQARRALPLDVFMGSTMLVASLLALPVAYLSGVPLWGYGEASWSWLWALVIITTLGGHGLMNLAATRVSMFELNLVIVLEPVIAIAMGALMFRATITPLQVAGGLLLGAAMLVGLRREARVTAESPHPERVRSGSAHR
jgi:drug/metabolite transporter (DMT)-like permease